MDDGGTERGPGGAPAEGGAVVECSIHEEFADPRAPSLLGAPRRAVLAGLAVVGVLVAVLVLVSRGGSSPTLPQQSVRDLGPVTTLPRSGAVTTLTAPSTPSTRAASGPVTTVTSPGSSGRTPTTTAVPAGSGGSSFVVAPAPPSDVTSTTAPPGASVGITATAAPSPPPTTTTTTTAPPTTTTAPPTTTTTTSCVVGKSCR